MTSLESTVHSIREDFPILQRIIHNNHLAYFDNAATTLKPKQVVNKIANHYLNESSSVHRGAHYLSEQVTDIFEKTRLKIKHFLNSPEDGEIIFTSGTTAAINLVAKSLGQSYFKRSDEILISTMEHHSNIVPWQMVAEAAGCKINVIPMNDNGELNLTNLESVFTKQTKLVALTYASNVLGTINPIKKIIDVAHSQNIPVLIDGAQAVSSFPVDLTNLDCDFFAFSGHKLFGPTGIGVLYGKRYLLEKMPPVTGGGAMILTVDFDTTRYRGIPYKFEAGTPHIAGVIGLGAAIDYISEIGFDYIQSHGKDLLRYATKQLSDIPGLNIVGTSDIKVPVLSFTLENIHPHDIGTILDREGIAIRTGHHCCEPLMKRLNIPATARASFSIYNTKEEVDRFINALYKAIQIFN